MIPLPLRGGAEFCYHYRFRLRSGRTSLCRRSDRAALPISLGPPEQDGELLYANVLCEDKTAGQCFTSGYYFMMATHTGLAHDVALW